MIVANLKKAEGLAALADEYSVLDVLQALGCVLRPNIELRGKLRRVPVEHLSVTPNQAATLRSAGLATAGDLADFMHAGRDLCAFRDIGPKTVEKVGAELLVLAYTALDNEAQLVFWANLVRATGAAA